MSVITTLETEGHAGLTAVEHAAAWLVGTVASAEESLAAMEKSNQLIGEAIAFGEASAASHGVPIVMIEDMAGAVLAAAKELAAGLSQPPATGPSLPAAP